MESKQLPLVAIVGPTASGKSAAAMLVAKQLSVEIICADSRTIYREASIGTAKPNTKDRSKAHHFGLDLANIDERFTTYEFKQYALESIDVIRSHGNIPLLVGGSGLYIDAVLFNYRFVAPNLAHRQILEQLSVSELQHEVHRLELTMPHNHANKRHLIGVIERSGTKPQRSSLRHDAVLFGILPTSDVLRHRINKRIEAMYETGFLDEVESLMSRYNGVIVAKLGIGYASAVDYLSGSISLNDAKKRFKQGDWQYARRQRTWFRRHASIIWSSSAEKCATKVIQFLR